MISNKETRPSHERERRVKDMLFLIIKRKTETLFVRSRYEDLFFVHLIYQFLVILSHYSTFQFQRICQFATLHTEGFTQ